jgi:hypothetical protein
MENNMNTRWILGIKLDDENNNIDHIEFFNKLDKRIYSHLEYHTNNGSKNFEFKSYIKCDSFNEWKEDVDIFFEIDENKLKILKEINLNKHHSLKKFLKSFDFDEYLI